MYRGLDFGLSAKTTLTVMKYDGDENYFFKRTIQAYMNRNEQFSR
jgi:hypothetical protein